MSTHPDAPRIIQANDVASIVIQQATEHAPDLFVTLDLRYGIADALWVAGYRKDSEVATLTAQLQAAQAVIVNVGKVNAESDDKDRFSRVRYALMANADTSALHAHDEALIRQHTQTILDATREATVHEIADAEVRGYQRKVHERITSALAERDRRIRDAVSGALVMHHGMVSTDPVLVAFDRAASIEQTEADRG